MNREKIKSLIAEVSSCDKEQDIEMIKKFIDYKERILLTDEEVIRLIDEIKNGKKIHN